MKNGKLVTTHLDASARAQELQASGDFDAWLEHMDAVNRTWEACLADGWTIAELDAAYERRTGRRVQRTP